MSSIPYSELSERSKRRRRIKLQAQFRASLRSDAIANTGPSHRNTDIAYAGPSHRNENNVDSAPPFWNNDIVTTGPIKNQVSEDYEPESSEDELRADEYRADEQDASVDSDEMVSPPRATLSDTEKLNSVLENWLDECPDIPMHYATTLLEHLHTFYPNVSLSSRIIKKVKLHNAADIPGWAHEMMKCQTENNLLLQELSGSMRSFKTMLASKEISGASGYVHQKMRPVPAESVAELESLAAHPDIVSFNTIIYDVG